MANFDLYFPKIKKHEGGYVNIAADRGGETYFGITRVNFPTWSGWAVIDSIKKNAVIKRNTLFPTLEPQVKAFYKANFWDKVKADLINSQSIAELYVDFFINSGGNAIKKMNESLKALNVSAINLANPTQLHKALLDRRIKFFNDIVKASPKQAVFLKGWLARAEAFAKDAPVAVAGTGIGIALIAGIGFFLLNQKYKWLK